MSKFKKGDIVKIVKHFADKTQWESKPRIVQKVEQDNFVHLKKDPSWLFRHPKELKLVRHVKQKRSKTK